MISKYRSLYDVVLDLKGKISFSLDEAIEYAYSETMLDTFSLAGSSSEEEWFAYYYVENALFRIEALWDILAQIYNIKYSLGLDKKHVIHSRIFSKDERWTKKVKKPIRVLTVDEQKLFIQYADKSHNAKQYRLLLQTGLRTGETIHN